MTMLKAKVTSHSSSRDDALTYLYDKLDSADWCDWKRSGDIILTERRIQFRAPVWVAATTMIRDEAKR